MDNIIFKIGNNHFPLGDELGKHRCGILNLLWKNFITKNCVIYCHKDRIFLYENIFDNIFECENNTLEEVNEYCCKKFNKEFKIVDIGHFIYHIAHFWTIYGSYYGILDKELLITQDNIFNFSRMNYYNNFKNLNENSEEFIKLVTNINYLEKLPRFNNEKFFVYHHRFKNNNEWDQNEETLNKMLQYQNKYKIVIFTHYDLNLESDNIYITNNLKEYASFLHSENCIAVLSVWSGGGQFSSYCSGEKTKLIMYFEQSQIDCDIKITTSKLNHWIESPNAFDFAEFTDVKRFFIKKQDIDFDKGIIEKIINDKENKKNNNWQFFD